MIWGCFAEFSGVRFLARYSEWEPHLGGSATRLRDRDGSHGHHSVGRAGSRWRRHRLCGIQNGVIRVFFSQHWGHASDRVLRKCPSVSTEVRSHLETLLPALHWLQGTLPFRAHLAPFPPAVAANLPPSHWASRQGWGWTWPGRKGISRRLHRHGIWESAFSHRLGKALKTCFLHENKFIYVIEWKADLLELRKINHEA